MNPTSLLFDPYPLMNLTLRNRVTMAPMFVGYADSEGYVSTLLIEHYREMAASGVALVVVEGASVAPYGRESNKTVRIDSDRFIPGLGELAEAIHGEGALAFLQLNHAGRYAFSPYRLAPSAVALRGETPPVAMSRAAVEQVWEQFAQGACRAKAAGFDGVEIHGGMGYLLVQFLSPRTNQRTDAYGGSLENRMRFPLRVVEEVQRAVGESFPIGYRLLGDEWVAGGFGLEEALIFARELAQRRPAYLSLTAGTHESVYDPAFRSHERQPAYLSSVAAAIKRTVPQTPLILAGRLHAPEVADRVLQDGLADLVGLARALFADPLWLKKASGEQDGAILECGRACSLCLKRAMIGIPAFCPKWDKVHRQDLLDRVRRIEDDNGWAVTDF